MTWLKPDWPVIGNIHAAVTLRAGGLSQGTFSSLNPALHVSDKEESVLSNRKIIADMLNLPADPVWLEQIHSDKVVKADQLSQLVQADASYTDQGNTVCAVLTADCLPVLLASMDGKKIAAIHAGWRGLLAGIITNTVKALGTTELVAWLGPAIGPECFEVGAEVREVFVNKSTLFSPAFKKKQQDKYLADIYQLAKIELASIGVTEVYGGNFCTVTDDSRFYSYRRDGETGRMATLIWRD